MTTRGRRHPQPPAAAEVLAGARCEHGALEDRCPLCRAAGLDPGTPAVPRPVTARPRRRRRRPKPEPQPVQLQLSGVDDDPGPAARRDR
jgi:hypothetical protein